MTGDLFKEIKNAVTDIQAADDQGFLHPLNRLIKLLQHSDLQKINQLLVEGVDIDTFLLESENTGGSMIDSKNPCWPEDQREYLGLRLLLICRLCEDDFAFEFSYTYYNGGNPKIIVAYQGMTRQLIIPFVRDYEAYVMKHGNTEPKLIKFVSKRIFIVHGHDGEAREAVARFLTNIGLEPIILHEQADRGLTVIEKVEENSDVGFAIVLLTPDDVGRSRTDAAAYLEPRVRQNVLLELGYFIAKLGRENVCTLKRGEVEIPSDFAGVVWKRMDENGGWKLTLGRELAASGQEIDWEKVSS